MDEDIYRLATLASPPAITTTDGFIQRDWVVRLAEDVASTVVERSLELRDAARSFLFKGFGGIYEDRELSAVVPDVRMFYVDANHAVLRVRLPPSRLSSSDVGMAGVLSVIRSLDELARIEDLQGYPRAAWPLVLQRTRGADQE